MRGSSWAAYLRNCRGATAVEFALTAPFFLIMILVIMETTLFFFASSNAEQAVHDFSRTLVLKDKRGTTRDHVNELSDGLTRYINPKYFKNFRIHIDKATSAVDFTKPITTNFVSQTYLVDRTIPIYVRAVFVRRQFTYRLFQPLWRLIGDPDISGLYAPIDVLVVIPFPPTDS